MSGNDWHVTTTLRLPTTVIVPVSVLVPRLTGVVLTCVRDSIVNDVDDDDDSLCRHLGCARRPDRPSSETSDHTH